METEGSTCYERMEYMEGENVTYRVTAETKRTNEYGEVITYGIKGVDERNDECHELADISTNYSLVKYICELLINYHVSLVHMVDIISDALYESEALFA